MSSLRDSLVFLRLTVLHTPHAMSSERRIRASQINGALSRGPVTPEGKRNSCANNLRHGLLAGSVVPECEKPEAFAELLSGLEQELQPSTATEFALVEGLAVARWRLMRLWSVKMASLTDEIENQTDPVTAATATGRAFRYLADNSRLLDILADSAIRSAVSGAGRERPASHRHGPFQANPHPAKPRRGTRLERTPQCPTG